MQKRLLGAVVSLSFLAACGGSGSSSDDDKTQDGSTRETDAGTQSGYDDASIADASSQDDGDAGDNGGEPGGPIFPDEPVTTQYWMRSDMDVQMMSGTDGATMTLLAYSLVAVTRSKTGYEMVDLQCQSATSNGKCNQGSPFCETIRADVHEGQAYAPAQRTLSFEGNHWASSACAQAVGWKWSCTKDTQDVALPSSDTDPLVYNPGEGQQGDVLKGIDVKFTIESSTFEDPMWCITAAVQKVDVIYSGELLDGDLALTGVVTDHGSKQNLLNDYCGTFTTPTAKGPGTLRLLAKTFEGGSDASTWTCPSLEEFQQGFAGN